jgi:hypothetical protein
MWTEHVTPYHCKFRFLLLTLQMLERNKRKLTRRATTEIWLYA